MKKKSPKIRQTKAKYNSGFQKFKNVFAGITMLSFIFILSAAVQGQTWSDPSAGYNRVFFEDFSQPYTGDKSFQGVNENIWEIRDRKSWLWPMEKDNVMVKPGGGLYTYGGRLPSVSSTDNTIEDEEVATSAIKTKKHVVRPGSIGPRIIRIRTEWDQRRGYIFQPWSFSSWVDVKRNGRTYRHGWEFDFETKGSEYDPENRTMLAHFNNHTWNRLKGDGMATQQSPRKVTIQLPDDPRAQITIEFRWRRGEDFYDPYQTYAEWWVEEVSDGVATGNMVRRYHWSPRHILENFRSRDIPIPEDAPPAEPLPPELEAVAPMNKNWFADNKYKDREPWDQLGDKLFQPFIAADDPSYTWLDVVKDSWTDEGAGSLIWWNGFAKDDFFLSDSKPLKVSDYEDHHSHVDDHQCFSSVIWGVAVFEPDESALNQASFTIYQSEDGNVSPLEGATIKLNNHTAYTRADGKATISWLTEGQYNYSVKKKGFTPVSDTVSVLSDTTFTDTLEVTDYRVTFGVKDADSGEPVSGAELVFNGTDYTTTAEGEAVIEEIPYSTYNIAVDKEGYEPGAFETEIFSDTSIVLEIYRDYTTVELTVVNRTTGAPINRALISVGDLLYLTGSDGYATADKATEGLFHYRVEADNYFPLEDSLTLYTDTAITVGLTPWRGKISFLVTDGENPVQGAEVDLPESEGTTGSDGRAIFYNRPARENYGYTIRKEGYYPQADTLYLETDTTVTVTLETITGVSQVSDAGVKIYPNPARNALYIKTFSAGNEVQIFSANGSLIRSNPLQAGLNSVDLRGFKQGVYMVKVIFEQGVKHLKIIKL